MKCLILDKVDPLYPSDFRCDYPSCVCLPLFEVYDKDRWFYTCIFHFIQLRVWKKYGWCIAEWLFRIPLIPYVWNWYAKR